MSSPVTGRVVAVTGGSRGIGFAIARAFVQRGAHVAIGAVREDRLHTAAGELGLSCYCSVNVSDPESFRAFLARVTRELGPVDVLVNNAGIMPVGSLLDEDDAMTKRAVEIDAFGMMVGTKQALELMIPRGRGHIVNICSTMGEVALPGMATYNASKAAAITFSDAARLEYRDSGVRISTVLPGAVNTELVAGLDGTVSLPVPGTSLRIPLVKPVEATEVARAVVDTVTRDVARARVYVPRLAGVLLAGQRLLPRRAAESLNLRMGGKNALNTDHEERRGYHDRISRDTR
ncbi:SDR family oxidoreductase [Nocardia puris]|uniref:Short-subunit dehydrogenase n=1 Tax=Nocardia puris TaxID=208602 RepID=A0A366E3F6_9NOCA|nr:SDR family oxidoreductase [Nocardia puris]MBF6214779.1 SDR family oxidoreductase [Nocardia puris]MBF6368747.1 SDR family oxidoreductase [Nocardia puris]MBF6462327.1 SDR family oxidoreductase [Nocardia puris]RBO96906.1 hypothetical protein DFR74_101925 [Nocardia puris]